MIWRVPHTQRTTRFAHGLVSSAQAGQLEDRLAEVRRLAAMDPRRATELVLALAELAAHSLAPPLPTDDDAVLKALRAAHAAYAQGLRLQWVIDGERDYQREKKRRQRQAKLALLGEQALRGRRARAG